MKKFVPVTIDDLEESARQEQDNSKSYRIGKGWLGVICYEANGSNSEYFKYIWVGHQITRERAIEILSGVSRKGM